jgi:hypothetical protein
MEGGELVYYLSDSGKNTISCSRLTVTVDTVAEAATVVVVGGAATVVAVEAATAVGVEATVEVVATAAEEEALAEGALVATLAGDCATFAGLTQNFPRLKKM